MVKYHVSFIIASVVWALIYTTGIGVNYMDSFDYEFYVIGVTLLCVLCAMVSLLKSRHSKDLRAYCILYLLASAFNLFTLTGYELAYYMSEHYFEMLIVMSTVLVVSNECVLRD